MLTLKAVGGVVLRIRVRWLVIAYVVIACGTAGLIFLRPNSDRLADLHVYWGAVRAVLHGDPLYGFHAENGDPFTYPPFAALVFLPLGLVPELVVDAVWTVATFVAFVALAWVTVISWRPRRSGSREWWIWACAIGLLVSAPGQSNVRFGQVSVFVVLLAMTDAVNAVPARWRGVLIGTAAAVKLTPLLFIVHLLMVGRRHDAIRAVGTFAGLGVIAGILLPRESWTYWTSAVFATSRIGDLVALGNQSVNGILLRAGVLDPWLKLVWVVVILIVCAAALWRARSLHRLGLDAHAAVLIGCATVAASPVSWTHHQFWTVLAAMLLVGGPAGVVGSAVGRAIGWALLAVMTVNLADGMDALHLGEHGVFLAANLRGVAVAAVCVVGFGGLIHVRTVRADLKPRERMWGVLSPRPLAAVVTGVLVFAVMPLPADANVGVSGGQAVRIVFSELQADPVAVNRALRSQHLAVEVSFLPVSPSLVNNPIGASVASGAEADQLAFEYPPGHTEPSDAFAVTVPPDLRGVIQLFVGRRATPGESYASTPTGGAEAPGEALHSHPVTGLHANQAASRLSTAGMTPIWRVDERDAGSLDVTHDMANLFVVAADPLNDQQVLIQLSRSRPDPYRRDSQAIMQTTPPWPRVHVSGLLLRSP